MNETIAIVAESVLQEPITAGYIVISILLSSIVACTLVGNLFVIAAILIDKNLQTTANQLVLSLAVADLMVACLVMPLGAYNDINQGWWLGKGVCEFWTSADVLCCTASILNLLAIALDRYWAVTNVDYIYKRTRRRVSLMILCAWTVGAVVSLAPIFGWKDPDFARRVLDEHKCLVSQDVGYQIFATISTFYAPLVLLLALYWRIFQVARKRIRYKPGGRKSGQTIATGGRQATNLMIESGKSLDARGGQGNSGSSEKGKQSGSCSKQVAAGATTAEAAGVKSFAQVKGKVAAEQRASARAANVKSDCSGYCDGQTAHCDARHSENKASSVGQPGASAATELTAVNFVAAASAAAAAAAAPAPGPRAQQEFNLTSAPTLTNDKFRLACAGAKAGDSDEFARLFVAPESRLCQQRTPNERSDESSDQRDNGVARGAGRATEEKGGIVGKKGAKMNEREICLRRADGSGRNGDGRQATPGGCTTAEAQDAACDQRMVQDHFLRTGSGAHPTQSPDENDDDNKTNELAQAKVSGANPTMIELGDKLTSVSGKRPRQPRDLEASEVGAPTDNDNEKNDDDNYRTADYNQPSSAYDRVRQRPSNNLCHAHQRSLLLVHEPGNRADVMNRQGSSGANNSSLAQLDAQLLASMTSDNLMRTTFGDCQHSAPTSSQVSECQACCCCGADDDGDRTQSEPEDDEKEDECERERNHRLRGACALPTSWHSDKRLACAGRMDDLGLLDKRLGVASGPASPPLPTKSSVDRIRELLASQGFKEPVPLRGGKSSRRQRRRGSRGRDQRSSSNNHWLGSASSPSSTASDFSPSESSTSSRSMLAAASTARLEPMQLIGADEFLEAQPAMQPISSPESATAAAVMTTLAGQADKLGDESKERHRDSNDNLGDKRAVRPLPGSPLRSPTELVSKRSRLTRAITTTTRRAVTDNHKIDCHPQQQQQQRRHQDEPLSIASQANIRRANFLRSRPSMASARVAPVASLTGLTRGDGAGSLVSSSSRATLSIRSRFRALGQLVSFVQTSRQFNSTSSAGSESAPATSSQSGDDEEGDDDDDNNRQPHADDHSRADEISERANSEAGGNQVLGAERPEAQQQAASRTTTTTTDPGGLDRVVGNTSGDIERVNGALAVINSISLSGGVALDGAAAALSGAPSAYPHGKHRATTLSPGPDGLVSGATHNAVATAKQPRQSAAQQRRQNMEIKREKKAAKTLAIITGVFVCCWLPFFLNAIVMPICGPACTPSDLILSVLLWLGYLNSLLNPIIYTIFSPDFRRAFHRLLCWPDQARNGRAHKQRAGGGGGGCRARTSSDTPPVPPVAVHHHQHHGEHHEAGARHRVAAMA